MIFARKVPKFYTIIARKIFFGLFFLGGGVPHAPVSYAYSEFRSLFNLHVCNTSWSPFNFRPRSTIDFSSENHWWGLGEPQPNKRFGHYMCNFMPFHICFSAFCKLTGTANKTEVTLHASFGRSNWYLESSRSSVASENVCLSFCLETWNRSSSDGTVVVFTAQCTFVQSTVLRSHVVRPSVGSRTIRTLDYSYPGLFVPSLDFSYPFTILAFTHTGYGRKCAFRRIFHVS